MFQSGRGKTRREKEQNVCIGGLLKDNDGNIIPQCKAFPSKVNKEKIAKNETKLGEILSEAFYWRRWRNSGGTFSENLTSSPVFECLMLVDAHFESFERNQKAENNKLLEFILKKPGL